MAQWLAGEQDHLRCLIAEVDALGNKTEYLNSDDGLPHNLIDATHKSKYLWWNTLAQVERFQDSGKNTHYRFDDRHHLIAVTDALNQTTTLERKPDGEVLRIQHPEAAPSRLPTMPSARC
jgi:YD repeat-containing protein